jgi:hypothetical protein
MRKALGNTILRSGLQNLYRDADFVIEWETDLRPDLVHLKDHAKQAMFEHIAKVIEQNRYKSIITCLPLFKK